MIMEILFLLDMIMDPTQNIWVLFPEGGSQWPLRVVASGHKWSAARVGVRGRQERAQARADCLSGG